MNVIELLKMDHRVVSDLFKSYEKEKDGADSDSTKKSLANQICQELTVHATVEEELFYPVVEAKAAAESEEETEDEVHEADEEHALVKILVAELQEMQPTHKQFDAKVKVLMDLVEHHVEEEEGELFPHTKKLLDKDQLEQMGVEVEARKAQLKQDLAAGRKPQGSKPPGASPSRTAQSIAKPRATTPPASQRAVKPAARRSTPQRSTKPARRTATKARATGKTAARKTTSRARSPRRG